MTWPKTVKAGELMYEKSRAASLSPAPAPRGFLVVPTGKIERPNKQHEGEARPEGTEEAKEPAVQRPRVEKYKASEAQFGRRLNDISTLKGQRSGTAGPSFPAAPGRSCGSRKETPETETSDSPSG